VGAIIRLQDKMHDLQTRRELDQAERQVEAYENRIDELVCELYGVKEIPE
jgi:hypothetical protein